MTLSLPKPLVSTAWLAEHLHDPDLRIVDVGYLPPERTKTGREHFARHRIPGAQFFDVDDIADTTVAKKHAFPPADVFSDKVGALGIGNGHRVVAYDRMGGIAAAARAWFLFRAFGHENVSILAGGWTAWEKEGRPTEKNAAAVPARQSFDARKQDGFVRSRSEVHSNLTEKRFQVLDSRAAPNFAGTEMDNWPGLRLGHIPGSRNLSALDLFDLTAMMFKSPDQMRALFSKAGVDLSKPLTASGASGITPCTIALAGYIIGKTDVQIYDGSWVDWCADPSLPIETGPPRPVSL